MGFSARVLKYVTCAISNSARRHFVGRARHVITTSVRIALFDQNDTQVHQTTHSSKTISGLLLVSWCLRERFLKPRFSKHLCLIVQKEWFPSDDLAWEVVYKRTVG